MPAFMARIVIAPLRFVNSRLNMENICKAGFTLRVRQFPKKGAYTFL
jgi:hypothetical protein